MIDFDYKIFNISDYLSNQEYLELKQLVTNFNIDKNEFKANTGALTWSDNVKNKLIEVDPVFYTRIVEEGYINYNDFKKLVALNKEFNFTNKDYFNFCMIYRGDDFFLNRIHKLYVKAYHSLLQSLFNATIEQHLIAFGHINVYPKNSFITEHTDSTQHNDRIFTSLFFINTNRKKEDGSLLRLYTNNGIVDIIPDFNTIVLLENKVYNYGHEVTENLIDDVRYSLYTPFTDTLYNKLITK
jgi:hypothetical protein